MSSDAAVRALALDHGSAKKRGNAIASMLCGLTGAIVLGSRLHPSWTQWLLGIAIGLVWSNAFEYVYHRWLLHWSRSSFARGHLRHHATSGTPVEAEHVTFGESPVYIVALFTINGLPLIAAQAFLNVGVAPGVFIGWAAYMIAVEEIHWRIHMREWLPPGLEACRAYHLAHHDIPDGRFNVFFPLFDFLLRDIRPPMEEIELPASACACGSGPRCTLPLRDLLLYAWVLLLVVHFRLFSKPRISV